MPIPGYDTESKESWLCYEAEKEIADLKGQNATLRARLAEVEAQRDGLKSVLIFIDEECDWEESKGDFGGGGDPRIGPAIREALAKLEAYDG
jgi:hypothetical protein